MTITAKAIKVKREGSMSKVPHKCIPVKALDGKVDIKEAIKAAATVEVEELAIELIAEKALENHEINTKNFYWFKQKSKNLEKI